MTPFVVGRDPWSRDAMRGELYYLARGSRDELSEQCAEGLEGGSDVFYLKVGIDDEADLAQVTAVREALGEGPRLRLDANGAWTPRQALRFLERAAEYSLDLVEQPVRVPLSRAVLGSNQ